MPASTLSLGQATYTLLDTLGATKNDQEAQGITAIQRGSGATKNIDIRAKTSADTIYDLGIGIFDNPNSPGNLNIFNNVSGLIANLGDGNDNFNLFSSVDDATINTNSGNDLMNAQRNLTNSTINSGAGNDTIRVTGSADNTNFFLESGDDLLSISTSSSNVYVNGGEGNDLIQFRGLVTDGFISEDGSNNTVVESGNGSDTVQFFNGLTSSSQSLQASINLGNGNDSLLIGGRGTYFNINVNAGANNDTITLSGSYVDSSFDLGDGKNVFSLSSEGTFNNVSLQSQSTTGDTLIFAPGTSIFNDLNPIGISLGSGGDSLVFGGAVNSIINTGMGADTIVFGNNSSSFFNTQINLGSDDSSDKVYFNMSKAAVINSFESLTITGQGNGDMLYIGAGTYTAYAWDATNDYWKAGNNDTIKFNG